MALVPVAGAAAGGGLAWLIGAVFQASKSILGSRLVQIGAGAGLGLGIDDFRREAVRISPFSDPEALEFAARQIHWMMGVADGDIIGPRDIRNWNYFHYDPRRGRAWWTRSYRSSKSMRGARRRGFGRGMGAGARRAVRGY